MRVGITDKKVEYVSRIKPRRRISPLLELHVHTGQGGFSGYADIAASISRERSNFQVLGTPAARHRHKQCNFILNGRWYGNYQFGDIAIRAGKDNGWFDSDAYGVAPGSVLGYSVACAAHIALEVR